MMDRFWLREYPPGVPHDIDQFEFASLKALIEDSCQRYANRIAYRSMGTSLTYAQLDRQSAAFGAWLQQSAGLKSGDRIAIMLPNLLQYPIAMFGALRAGLVVVNTNPLYTVGELEHQLKDSGAVAIVVLENFATTLEQVLAQGRALNLMPVVLDQNDLAYLQYTGGTTGVAKGAMLTHGNMVANILQSRAWFLQMPLDHATFVCALPLYHIFSLTANCWLFAALGGTGLLIANPRDFPGFLKDLKRHPPMFFMGVNTLFNALMHTPQFSSVNFSKLAVTVAGGMALQSGVAAQWKQLTGCKITQGWGLTEASPVGCANKTVGDDVEFNGSIGLPIPSTDLTIRDDAGQELPIGGVGEICLRGPQVMRGYWKRPEETANVMLPDGWLRTGDIGRINGHGYVFIEDRKKDMIIVSGFKVYPNEIEDVLSKCPGVLEVAAVSQADEHSGEVVALFIVRKDPLLTEQAVRDFAHQHLTNYKRPHTIVFRDELPKTNVGKILRRELRDELAKSTTKA